MNLIKYIYINLEKLINRERNSKTQGPSSGNHMIQVMIKISVILSKQYFFLNDLIMLLMSSLYFHYHPGEELNKLCFRYNPIDLYCFL